MSAQGLIGSAAAPGLAAFSVVSSSLVRPVAQSATVALVRDVFDEITVIADTGGGGGGDYIAKAVHFDGTAWLVNDALTATDNGFVSWTGFLKFVNNSGNSTFAVVDPDNSYTTSWNYSGSSPIKYYADLESADASASIHVQTHDGSPVADVWHSIVGTAETDFASGQKRGKLYIDRIDVTELVDSDAAFTLAFNGLPFWFGNDDSASGATFDCADVRFITGVSFLSAGDIPVETLDLFVTADNKPVDPAVATAALGAAGAVLFSGDATTFGTNQGTGGSFTLTGSLTNATTSPSD